MGGQELLLLVLVGIWYLSASILVGIVAEENGRSNGGWFFASLFFSPLFTILCLIALGMKRTPA